MIIDRHELLLIFLSQHFRDHIKFTTARQLQRFLMLI